MNETRFPAGTVVPRQTPRAGDAASDPNARLIGVPNDVRAELQTRRASLRVQGEVVRNNDDGSVRVRTDRGDIDVRVARDQPQPERGQRVEIEIQPGRSPDRAVESATIRALPSSNTSADGRSTSTPINVEVRPQTESAAPPARQPLPADIRHANSVHNLQSLPLEGSVVRLDPLPARIQNSLPQVQLAQDIVSTLTQRAVFSVQDSAQQTINALQSDVINIRSFAPQPLNQTPIVSVVNAPLLQPVTSALPQATQPQPALTQTIANNAIFNVQQTETVQPLQVSITPAPPTSAASEIIFNVITPNIAAPTAPITVKQAVNILQNPDSFIKTPSVNMTPAIVSATPAIASSVLLGGEQSLQSLKASQSLVIKALALDAVIAKVTPPEITIQAPVNFENTLKAGIPGIPGTQKLEQASENLILQNQNAGSITGVVTNVTRDSLPVLTVFFSQFDSQQSFFIQFPSENITIGTRIQVTPQTASSSAPVLNGVLPQNVPLPMFIAPQPWPWPSVDEALQTLARAAPQAAQAMVNVTPSPANPAQFGPAIMFFIAALRGGDLSQWLGDKASDILRGQKGGNALNRLLGDGATLSRIASEPMPQDWRALNIPLFWGGDIHKIGLYFRHERDESDDDAQPLKGTRFVFDLALDNMGKVQLDGLFRAATGQIGRLDLVVRTEEHFSQSTQAQMRGIYAKALRDTQVTGELSFQNQPESWVSIQADEQQRLGVSA